MFRNEYVEGLRLLCQLPEDDDDKPSFRAELFEGYRLSCDSCGYQSHVRLTDFHQALQNSDSDVSTLEQIVKCSCYPHDDSNVDQRDSNN